MERFIDLVLDAARASPCTVLLTVRADFYGDLLRHGGLATAVPPGLVNLGPMGREGLADAIREPARAVGLAVDEPLVGEMLDEVCDDLGKLPLLEYALKETWAKRDPTLGRLTLDAYGKAGGIDGAVAKRADEVFGKLGEAGQAAARRLFVSLIAPGEAARTRAPGRSCPTTRRSGRSSRPSATRARACWSRATRPPLRGGRSRSATRR